MLPILTPSDFVAILNQTLELTIPAAVIEGELANFRVSKNKWVYFDIKDEQASVKFFGTVYSLPGPLEDGMKLQVSGQPRLHPQFGFSINIQSISLSGEGTIKKAFDLLQQKLKAEGLFETERKRSLPYPPTSIGLITSSEAAAYSDFVKVLGARWGGVEVQVANVQVQGQNAASQVERAVEWFNERGDAVDALVIIRGGGSMDDLQAFNSERLTRTVAASRIPILAAIGHERDVTLVELAADVRASTPSNAAELLVPERRSAIKELSLISNDLSKSFLQALADGHNYLSSQTERLVNYTKDVFNTNKNWLVLTEKVMELLNPRHVLSRGYVVVRKGSKIIKSAKQLNARDKLLLDFQDGQVKAEVQ